jgi:hypothetical protein
MTRRKGRSDPTPLIGVVILLAGIVWLFGKIRDSLDFGVVVAIIVLVSAGIIWLAHWQRQKRIQYLRQKYGDEETVRRILRRVLWQGETAEQLLDSIGNPVSTDNKVMATRRREVWKYRPAGRNRYSLRVTLDDGIVIGWDQKN